MEVSLEIKSLLDIDGLGYYELDDLPVVRITNTLNGDVQATTTCRKIKNKASEYRFTDTILRYNIVNNVPDDAVTFNVQIILGNTIYPGVGVITIPKDAQAVTAKTSMKCILYEDGDITMEMGELEFDCTIITKQVEPKSPRQVKLSTTTTLSPISTTFKEGDKIECNYQSLGNYFSGRVSAVRNNFNYDVNYDDGEVEHNVSIENIRMRSSPKQNVVPELTMINESIEIIKKPKSSGKNITKSSASNSKPLWSTDFSLPKEVSDVIADTFQTYSAPCSKLFIKLVSVTYEGDLNNITGNTSIKLSILPLPNKKVILKSTSSRQV